MWLSRTKAAKHMGRRRVALEALIARGLIEARPDPDTGVLKVNTDSIDGYLRQSKRKGNTMRNRIIDALKTAGLAAVIYALFVLMAAWC